MAKMKHVSVFRLKEEYRNAEIVALVKKGLDTIAEELPTIIHSEVGTKPLPMPSVSPDGHVDFYDLIQIITFANEQDCQSYPMSKAHGDFLALSHEYMEKVIGIDYPVD